MPCLPKHNDLVTKAIIFPVSSQKLYLIPTLPGSPQHPQNPIHAIHSYLIHIMRWHMASLDVFISEARVDNPLLHLFLGIFYTHIALGFPTVKEVANLAPYQLILTSTSPSTEYPVIQLFTP